MKKYIATLLVSLLEIPALAADILGEKYEFNSEGGLPVLEVLTSKDSLDISFAFSVSDLMMDDNITTVAVKFVNKQTGDSLTDWVTILKANDAQSLRGHQAGTISVIGPRANRLVNLLPSSAVLMLVTNRKGQTRTGYFDLGSYCTRASTVFVNTDTGRKGCPISLTQSH